MFLFGQTGFIWTKLVVCKHNWLYSHDLIVFGQNRLNSAKWLYLDKIDYIRANWLHLRKNGCIRANWLYFGKIGCIWANFVVFGQNWFY